MILGVSKMEQPRNEADDDRNYYHVGDPAAENALTSTGTVPEHIVAHRSWLSKKM
jgi:hypothetical protein